MSITVGELKKKLELLEDENVLSLEIISFVDEFKKYYPDANTVFKDGNLVMLSSLTKEAS